MTYTITLLLIAMAGNADPNTISGTVTGADGKPIPTARVFLEPDLGGELREVPLTVNGEFVFENVPMGPVGIFATAPGYAYAGRHQNVTLVDEIPPVNLVLPDADILAGTITDRRGRPISGAQISRIALMDGEPVAIPLTKLREFGFPVSVSDEDGKFAIPMLPKGGTVSLKIGHSSYAMEGVSNVKVGDRNYHVTMYPGVLVRGDVLSRDNRLPVANATILITNAQPPRDTSVATTDQKGVFAVRLKSGVYSYRASGAGLRSSGGERLLVNEEESPPRVRLVVAGSGYIRGEIKDAHSGEPVPNARVLLYTNNTMAAITRTGSTGEYRFEAMEGENMIVVEHAPGYLPAHDQRTLAKVTQGEGCEVTPLWLAPLPKYVVEIIDEDQAPIPGTIINVLQPRQFGFQIADSEGRATLALAQAPGPEGLIGLVEDPKNSRGAVFRIPERPEGAARVQLFPFASARGTVESSRGRVLEGALVAGVLSVEEGEPTLLWRTLSNEDGVFEWPGIVPGVPQYCAVWDDEGGEAVSSAFNVAPGESKEIAPIVVDGGRNGNSRLGRTLDWRNLKLIAGPPPSETPHSQGSIVLYTTSDIASVVIESMEKLLGVLGSAAPECAVVVEGSYTITEAPFPVLSGSAPGRATALILDSEDQVQLETFGLPPFFALRETKVQ